LLRFVDGCLPDTWRLARRAPVPARLAHTPRPLCRPQRGPVRHVCRRHAPEPV